MQGIKHKMTALLEACWDGCLIFVRNLLDSGAEVPDGGRQCWPCWGGSSTGQ